ncbi:MAG: DNA mismatch repair endonuclease MutL, partial [Lachnospiraceae bacterium]|nr:DNA mismatch repair endonuclease MutL [Lachnospiraceae bacterium]
MPVINLLSQSTIDKIAAGEVVERPLSVVKELTENAIDAGAAAITVEIKEGGISFILVKDNGWGIEKEQVKKAFLRHATSKIASIDDLNNVKSLGFRGEALSSIAAVSQMEVITKTENDLTGVRYCIAGGVEETFEEIGAPGGTTFLVHNLFFNTPVRKKFLKQPQTEGSYVSDMMEHLALSHPHISIKFIQNGQIKFHTSGNGNLKEVIYRIYGKDITEALLPFSWKGELFSVRGFLGKPEINRANRNFETYFVNGRYVKNDIITKAMEEGYRDYLMQHKFPFFVLHFTMEPDTLDVNVHPAKMEIRLIRGNEFYDQLSGAVRDQLHKRELIPGVKLEEPGKRQESLKEKQLL